MEETAEITFADVIIEMMPFSSELSQWCQTHPKFKAALKFANNGRFLPIGAVMISYPKNKPEDQVVGFFVYDMQRKHFKQDYIVNEGGKGERFVLYSKSPGQQESDVVKSNKQFFSQYDVEGGYGKDHWLTLEEIDAMAIDKPFLSQMAHSVVRIAESGPGEPSQEQLHEALLAIRELKAQGLAGA